MLFVLEEFPREVPDNHFEMLSNLSYFPLFQTGYNKAGPTIFILGCLSAGYESFQELCVIYLVFLGGDVTLNKSEMEVSWLV